MSKVDRFAFKVEDQMSHFGLDQTVPLQLVFFAARRGFKDNEMPIFGEEIWRLE
jgi:hypothetical protein